jgi:hypothetical protein
MATRSSSKIKTQVTDRLWLCRDYRLVKISEMSDSHLESSIRLVERRAPWREDYLPALKAEKERRRTWKWNPERRLN